MSSVVPHTLTIYVNTRAVEIPRKEFLTFDELVQLAFPGAPTGESIIYTITYRRGAGSKPEGTLVAGDSVSPKNGTIFDVTRTDRS